MNLRTRFVLISAGLMFVLATCMSIGAYRIASSQLENQVNSSLDQRASRILVIMSQPDFSWNDSFGPGPVNQAIMQTEVDAITQIVLPNGQIVGRREYPRLPITDRDRSLSIDGKRIHRSKTIIDRHSFRTLTVLADDGSLIQVAKDTQILINARNGMRLWFPIFAAIAVVVSALFGWLFARRISRPIEDLALVAETIAETQDLDSSIEVTGRDEVAQLATSFNTMLEALRGSVARQRQLVQDASHELRTPLTSLRANTELLERGTLSDADRTSILADMRAEVDELADLSAELSALAIDQKAAELAISIDLSELASEIAQRSSRRSGVTVSVHSTTNTVVTARPHQLERALSNLIDNAIKFTNDGSEIEVHVGAYRVEVRDKGIGISDSDKPHVFDRFYRAVATRSMPGSGLGLAIVSQFAADHNANAYVLDNAGGGAIVGLQFPIPAV
ncbi:MAG: HAMP domain-containing protein [Actinobacteria bacterium]|uniref:histidine kinase n=1 Tax=freshwater metagenome TaxID=449393 RepID=A0A6J6MS45_9ZZZZ|nr:HAMP domain-containing protein [Actinomycetota bacterium]MSZ80655.1 HAMP domain-containing protein [Actinomycetota bacterium]MTB11961.1 HAMP domain-containing protein [Actinomycetota bacterium]